MVRVFADYKNLKSQQSEDALPRGADASISIHIEFEKLGVRQGWLRETDVLMGGGSASAVMVPERTLRIDTFSLVDINFSKKTNENHEIKWNMEMDDAVYIAFRLNNPIE